MKTTTIKKITPHTLVNEFPGELKDLYKIDWKNLDGLIKEHGSMEFLKALRIFYPIHITNIFPHK